MRKLPNNSHFFQAPLYSTLKQAIQLGCKVAIRIAEKV